MVRLPRTNYDPSQIMLILNCQAVQMALPMKAAIEAMKTAFLALGKGDVEMPLRTHLPIADQRAELLTMPAYVGGDNRSLAVKVVGVFPNNVSKGIPLILGLVNVIDPESGAPQAILEGATITGIRTAAVSGVATEYLSRPDSRTLAVIGSGVQARTHIEAVCAVRKIDRIQVYSRTKSKIEALISDLATVGSVTDQIDIMNSGDKAVAGADIVCAVTNSSQPVFSDSAIEPGTHINAVGSHDPAAREIPSATVKRALVVVDQKQVALRAGDLFQPIEEGVITSNHVVAELSEVVSGETDTVRNSKDEITFFKSVGLAMEDAVAARLCLQNAIEMGLGPDSRLVNCLSG